MGKNLSRLVVLLVAFAFPVLALTAPAYADQPSTFLASVNNLRASVNAPALAVNSALTTVAQQWANEMASTGVLAHNPNLSTQAPPGWTVIGENIGDGYSLTAVYNALVASPPHYANMVNVSFNQTGVGVSIDSSGQVWVAQDFADYPPPPAATMVFPTTGTTIFPSAQTFSWNQATGAQYYCLTVGTTQGDVNLYNSGLLSASQLSASVPALPGGTLWARLYTYNGGTWLWGDTSFSVTGPSTAMFTQPTNGATNISTTQPLTWSGVAAATYYGISVGTTQGGYDVVNTGPLPSTQTSYQPSPALPAGQKLWARVYSYIGGSWNNFTDVSFTTA